MPSYVRACLQVLFLNISVRVQHSTPQIRDDVSKPNAVLNFKAANEENMQSKTTARVQNECASHGDWLLFISRSVSVRGCAFKIRRQSGTAACVTRFGSYKMYRAVSVNHFHTQIGITEQYHTMKKRRTCNVPKCVIPV